MSRVGELAVAVALDAVLGEPPTAAHPVVGMGRILDALEVPLRRAHRGQVLAGGLAWSVGAVGVWALASTVARSPWPVRGVALWGLGSGRMLLGEAAAVERALSRGLPDGRSRVARIVSRDTSELTPAEVRAAAISSLAENLCDAAAATLWWWTLGGLRGAALHRFFDTADSRWGYRDAVWEHRGRVAARADDVAAWVPARLAALAWAPRPDRRLPHEARRTPSPNGGWPMAAAALHGDVRLDKRGSYVLHADGHDPDAADVVAARRRAGASLLQLVLLTGLVATARDAADRRRRTGDTS